MDKTPESILIVGSGVFGLSVAWALTKRPRFANTAITVVDHVRGGPFPPEDSASVDSSRIIRGDYSDADYTVLGDEAQAEWRKEGDHMIGGQGRYFENGIVVLANDPGTTKPGKKTGMYYALTSCENVKDIARRSGVPEKIVPLPSRKALQDYVGTDGYPGDWGYLNKLSGWADNGAAMRWTYGQVKKTGRVNFVDAEVRQLVTEGKKVTGAELKDGRVLKADMVYVAAGAWTGSLIDLRGRCEATGQIVGYVDITEEEQKILEHRATVFNVTTGLFIIPPRDRLLKVGRHSYGYLNPTTVTTALPPSPSHERKPIVTSVPWTARDNGVESFPAEGEKDLRWAMKNMLPIKGVENRPWKKQRICWYSDTRDADWLADWHPGWEGLFVATGDSGHGFKFLPVLGDKLVDVMEGKGGKLGDKWRWRPMEDDGVGKETNGVFKGLMTEDGSRGYNTMILTDDFKKEGGRLQSKL
ncbi:hypothetical protein ACO1O0_001885 [Amphichorda felina]